ncbi:MAG: patatin-like phospholipase family protein, partial [Alkalispirochaeta sp.]
MQRVAATALLIALFALPAPPVPTQEASGEGAADTGSTSASQVTGAESDNTLGLVLAGGGALGFGHVGVLLVLEQYGLSPEVVVGTSMGGIVGALYSAGYSSREILALAESIDWSGIFFDEINRRQTTFDDRRADRLFRGRLTFEDGELQLLG